MICFERCRSVALQAGMWLFEPVLQVIMGCLSHQGTWKVDAGVSFFSGDGISAQFPELVAGLTDLLLNYLSCCRKAELLPKLWS